MAKIPAICDSCGTFFVLNNIIGGNAGSVTFTNCRSTCPKCGESAHILDGTYQFIDDTIKFLKAPEHTILELQRLSQILQGAMKKGATTEEINNQVRNELPKLSAVSKFLPNNKSELCAYIMILIAVINLLIQILPKGEKLNITHTQVINNIQVIQKSQKYNNATDKQSVEPKKRGRNSPCPCKSGKKYKYCCGK
ncbi:MAG: SEC-C metal-binding domain-containing protein [Planctomycetota bacterium]